MATAEQMLLVQQLKTSTGPTNIGWSVARSPRWNITGERSTTNEACRKQVAAAIRWWKKNRAGQPVPSQIGFAGGLIEIPANMRH